VSLQDAVITVTKGGKKKEQFIVNLPNIRNLQGYLKGFWDFDKYSDAFPAKNKLSDVDGSIELNGHTLHIEFKESKFALNKGQVLKAVRQAKYSNITTLFVFGKTNEPEEYIRFSPNLVEGTGYLPCSDDILHDVLARWVAYTKENNLVGNRTEEWNIVKKYC
jgi:hypothetical protein